MKHLKALLAVALAAVALPSAASAATAPGYEEFGDCPDRAVNPGIVYCTVFEVSSGHLKMGSKNVPIVDPITMTLGVGTEPVLGAFDGGSQPVPGGVIGITGLDWLSWLFPFSLLTLNGEAQLAGDVENVPGGDIGLPLKVKLKSPVLNNHCYIGSDSSPIALRLTSGTTSPPPPNQPISGNPGTTVPDPSLPLVYRSTGIKLVDNAFAVPGANGCDLLGFGLINGLVNLTAGLPAAAGTNETVQNASTSLGLIQAVYPPAGIEQ